MRLKEIEKIIEVRLPNVVAIFVYPPADIVSPTEFSIYVIMEGEIVRYERVTCASEKEATPLLMDVLQLLYNPDEMPEDYELLLFKGLSLIKTCSSTASISTLNKILKEIIELAFGEREEVEEQ